MLTRRDFLRSLSAGAAGAALPLLGSSCTTPGPARPNVILIMTDDQGYGDFGVTGNPVIRTPHIDALARGSAQMTQFYVCPVCSPTRASLMTGRYHFRTRVVDTWLGRSMLEPDETTMAELLHGAGYATGIFGKWHLGDNHPMRPMDQGFEESLVHRGGGIGQPADPTGGEGKYTDPILFRNGEEVQETGYCTDVYFARGMEWMERTQVAGRNFFLYLPTNAPHGPFHDVPADLYESYKKEDLGNGRFPQDEGHPLPDKINADKRARIYSMITNVDDNVGRLIARLETLGILDNTIVIFLVDNGPNTRRYVAGMKGAKSSVHEGGTRSPLFVHWPARLAPGARSDRIAAHIDILPTIAEACGVPLPDEPALDGRSLLPLLAGTETAWPDRHLVIQAHRGDRPVPFHNFFIRNQRWKLVNPSGFGREKPKEDSRFELYDMAADPLEMSDLSAENPGVVEELKEAYLRWFDDVSSTRPDNYAPPRIAIGTDEENPVVLTRQDWRSMVSWGRRDATGHWLLRAERGGTYDVRVRLLETSGQGKMTLEFGNRTFEKELPAGSRSVLFAGLAVDAGDFTLNATAREGDRTYGPYQVDVTAIATERQR